MIRIQTLTKPNILNVNNVTYSEEVLKDAIKKEQDMIEQGYIKLTDGSVYKSNNILHGINKNLDWNTVKLESIIGTVRNIGLDFIDVEPLSSESINVINLFLENGYLAGMRYIADVDETRNITEIYRIIAFDMIKIPNK